MFVDIINHRQQVMNSTLIKIFLISFLNREIRFADRQFNLLHKLPLSRSDVVFNVKKLRCKLSFLFSKNDV